MKALVLGATGHIGNAVVRDLLDRGYDVTAAYRQAGPRPNLQGLPVDCRPGDQDWPGQMARWVEGHELVIDAATPYPTNLYNRAAAAAERRTFELLNAVKRRGCVFGYVSSFTTLKRSSVAMENWGTNLAMRLHPYFALKQRLEDLVMSAAGEGLRTVIINPTMCLGPWDAHDRELCMIPRLLSGEVPGAVNQILNVIDVREVANGLVSAIESERYGKRMIFSGHNISVQNLFSWICEVAEVNSPSWPTAPISLTAFAALGIEAVLGIALDDPPLKSLAPVLMYQHEWLPPCPAFQELGIPVRPLYETLRDSIDWYRDIDYC